jgi:iron complex outermembrane recepter protein
MTLRHKFKSMLLATMAVGAHCLAAQAQNEAPSDQDNDVETVIVTSDREATQSAVSMNNVQAQKIIPGVSPLKAIETLPGVVYETADPWGNNEQNESLVVHGFTTQQLGYTMDGVPLGDQQYGNYNGLSPTRAITSENVRRVTLESGTGSLGVASTSNLGGAIETFSSDPLQDFTVDGRETLGSYDATRTFLRVDSGDLGDGNAFYVSYLHQDQRAWDFDAHQRGDQVNLKYVHEDDTGRFTFFADWNTKVEPNEDAVDYGNQQTAGVNYFPYTRSLYYPNLTAAIASLTNGTPPASQGNNFTDYHSAAQREDVLTYAKYDWHLGSDMTWSNQLYFHDNASRGIVAGPINQAGLPGLFEIYYPQLVVGGSTSSAATLTNIADQFGGTGYEVRTTEYRINRFGELSTFNWQLGDHTIEVGAWFERNASSTGRRWYPFSATNDDLTPYTTPRDPNFTQYDVSFRTDDIQLHAQDQWHILPDLTLQAGVKSSLQTAGNNVLTQQQNLQTGNAYGLSATSPQVNFPVGAITSNEWLLPQVGAIWSATDSDQIFVNIQENVRQFIPYAAGSNFYGTSPWSLGSQLAFNTFRQTAHPERSWTYEVGVRSSHELDLGPITAIDGQANYYHVDFYNRLFNVATYNFINPNPSILVNVGGVSDDGVDLAGTVHFGDHFEAYDAVSWNQSQYDDNYSTVSGGVSTVVAIAGKQVPIVPNWLNRFILSTNWYGFDAQFSGDFIGRRFATYLDDWRVGSSFITGLEAGYGFDVGDGDWVKKVKISGNITNLADVKGISSITVTGASGGFQGYPIPPRMFFVTLGASL